MPIYLRNDIWQIDIATQGGQRIRRSAKTKNKIEAQELYDKLKYEQWRVEKIGDKPRYLWDEACIRWIQEKSHKRSLDDDKAKIRDLNSFRGKFLDELNRDYIIKTISGFNISNATKNRYLSLIRSILRKSAGEWEWLDRAPTLTSYKETKKRIRWINRSEATNLISALPYPVSDIALFSLMTGLRQSNVLNLEWKQIDLKRQVAWVYADQAKGNKPIGVPLNNTATSILAQHLGKNEKYVFIRKTGEHYNGISSKTWANALKKANINNFRWHDLRHTWASWLVQSGVPLMELKEMGGWESIEMVMKYAHLAPEHLQKNASKVDFLCVATQKTNATNLSHKKIALTSELISLS